MDHVKWHKFVKHFKQPKTLDKVKITTNCTENYHTSVIWNPSFQSSYLLKWRDTSLKKLSQLLRKHTCEYHQLMAYKSNEFMPKLRPERALAVLKRSEYYHTRKHQKTWMVSVLQSHTRTHMQTGPEDPVRQKKALRISPYDDNL